MSRHRMLPLVALSSVLIASVLISCRSKQEGVSTVVATASQPTAGAVVTERSEEEEEPPELVTIEVTRVVVETEVIVVSPEPEEVVEGPKELVICIGEEPETLYPYGHQGSTTAAEHVRSGIYEPLFTTRSFAYQAHGLEKIPSLADDDAVIQNVVVSEGDTVVDVDGDLVSLREGVKVLNLSGQEIEFGSTPMVMTQMVVTFLLKPMIWSDGTPVSADDSVFSFEIASEPQTPVPKNLIDRTESYEATDDLTVEWTGVPGYFDRTYFTNVWTPFPRHYWGELTAEELLDADVSTRRPLSSGPFVLSEWVDGDQITLVKNENYYSADQGYPRLDTVRFMFVPSNDQLIASLLSGQCDIGTHEGISMSDVPSLLEAEENGLITPIFQIGTVFEHVDFGINPVQEVASERPDWFEDVRLRRALVMCTDRQAMVDELLYGRSEVIDAYIPNDHPLYPDDITVWPYDPDAANELLENAGYVDSDEDGLREDPRTGSIFKVELLSSIGSEVAEKVAFNLREDLIECGVEVETVFMSGEEYFADGPEGPLFGRRFDLGAFPWLISIEPNCALYMSSRIPGPENAWNRGYNNETGFTNDDFDAACNAALNSLPGMPEFEESHRQALRIWADQVPIIPLFIRLKVAATRPEVQNLGLDPTQPSELWNLYEIDLAD